MEENGDTIESDDIVIIVENEAESKPIQEAKPKEEGSLGLLDICPLCKLSFHSREPKLLPCLHSFCKRCLPSPSRSLAYTEQSTNHQMSAEGQGKPCMITSNHPHYSVLCPCSGIGRLNLFHYFRPSVVQFELNLGSLCMSMGGKLNIVKSA